MVLKKSEQLIAAALPYGACGAALADIAREMPEEGFALQRTTVPKRDEAFSTNRKVCGYGNLRQLQQGGEEVDG